MALLPQQQSGASIVQRVASQESLLLEYVQRLEKHRKGRAAVHIHMSALSPENRRDQHVRIAANTFESMVKMLQGQLFVLRNSDMIFIFKKANRDEVEAAIVKLRFMFADDPLIIEENAGGSEDGNAFVTWRDLEQDYDALLAMAQELVEEQQKESQRAAEREETASPCVRRRQGEPLGPLTLHQMESGLERADLSNLVRRQTVCVIVGKAPPQKLFSEVFVAIGELRDTLAPNVDLTASPWLFQHLTETLDRRVLSMLIKNDDRTLSSDISINLNVATVLSPDFLRFDDNISASMRGSIVLEFQKADIYADLGAFSFARDFVRERSYRVCIDGVTIDALPYVGRARLGADLIKLNWDPSIGEMDKAAMEPVVALIRRQGPGKVILCRCDSHHAIETGQKLGISMFQGRHVENILYAEQKRQENSLVKSVLRKPRLPPEEI